MRYFVTGATGFVGGALVRQLLATGHEVVALVRDPARADRLRALGARLLSGDIGDKESMRAGVAGADGVFHLAAWYRVGARDSGEAERINVDGTRNVLDLMRELGCPRGVYTSTLAVFSDTGGRVVDESYRHVGPFLTVYERTKWQAHFEVAEPAMRVGLPLVIVQPGVVYGPGDTSQMRQLWQMYLARRLPVLPRRTAYCWGHVEDTARAHILAMERGQPGETYIIAGPPHSLLEAFQIAERTTGIRAPAGVPPELFGALARLTGALERIVPLPDGYRAESLRVLAGTTYLGSNDRARRDLGIEMRPLEAGLGETLAAFESRRA